MKEPDHADRILDREPPALEVGGTLDPAAPLIALAVAAGPDLPDLSRRLLQSAGLDLTAAAGPAEFTGRAGTTLTLTAGAGRIVCVGTGARTPADLRRAGAAAAAAARGASGLVTDLADGLGPDHTSAVVEGLLLGAFSPLADGTRDRPRVPATITLTGAVHHGGLDLGRHLARAGWLARDLAGVPASVKNPGWLAGLAETLGARAGLTTQVLAGPDLDRFGCLRAVGAESGSPPRVVVLRYQPTDPLPQAGHVVLVGKGITFDTGGLSLKPREGMVAMRTDMSGAGAALAVVLGAARAAVRRPVTAVLALAENSIGGGAYRPGDVLTSYDGTTVEIANTDAEGRLVLADTLAYACAELAPDILIDLATLTGAATLGLGRQHAALFTGDEVLAADLTGSGLAAGEYVWRLPLVEDYRQALDSGIADLCHIPTSSTFGGGGAITAALFLREFTGGHPAWAHLDIAGPARADAAAHEVPKGPTGYGARLLLRWLLDGDRAEPDQQGAAG